MPLDLSELDVTGLAIPSSYLRHELETWLVARKLFDATLADQSLQEASAVFGCLAAPMQAERAAEALKTWLAYDLMEFGEAIACGAVDGALVGYRLVSTSSTAVLRIWLVPHGVTLDTPCGDGIAYRYRAAAVAERKLRQAGDKIGLLTNGRELRVLFADASEHESSISLSLAGDLNRRSMRDGLRLIRILCLPSGQDAATAMLAAARAWRRKLVRTLRVSVRNAVEQFIQRLLELPENRERFEALAVQESLASVLFHESLVLAYRLLLVLRHENPRNVKGPAVRVDEVHQRVASNHSTDAQPAKPSQLARTHALVARLLERLERQTGKASEASTQAFAHELFGHDAMPTLETLAWSDGATDALVEGLLSPTTSRGDNPQIFDERERQRVDVAALDIEDLGHVYEGLLDFEPGIAREPMCRLRGSKLEVVLPLAHCDMYRQAAAGCQHAQASGLTKRTQVAFVEAIAPGSFYLRVGLGRKTSGSYYTPKIFVQFLVQETLLPQLEAKSPVDDPNPAAILALKVIDPAMGSGHFLVEACRRLGEALLEAYCLCRQLERAARSTAKDAQLPEVRHQAARRSVELAKRLASAEQLAPDLVRDVAPYADSFADARRQNALNCCRRAIACRCLYGIDKEVLAVSLARAALGLVCCADASMPILDCHLIVGDCLTGASLEHLTTLPHTKQPIAERQGVSLEAALREYMTRQLQLALRDRSAALHASLRACDAQDRRRQERYEEPLSSMQQLAAAYIGGVMLESGGDDAAYAQLAWSIATNAGDANLIDGAPLRKMVELGKEAVAFELCFPEVFFPKGNLEERAGFNAVLGNPPWDAIKFNTKEFLATFDLRVLEAPTKRERDQVEIALTQSPEIAQKFNEYKERFTQFKRSNDRLYSHQKLMIDGDLAGRQLDRYRLVIERASQILTSDGFIGLVVPSSFHTAAGAAGVRRLLTEPFRLLKYVSFINDLKHFDIAAGIEFGLLLAAGPATPSGTTSARFRLRDPEALACVASLDLLEYPVHTLCAGNPYLTFPTVANAAELEALLTCRQNQQCFRDLEAASGVEIRSTPTSVHMTHESKHFIPMRNSGSASAQTSPSHPHALGLEGRVLLHEGATFGRYTDRWSEPPRLAMEHARVASSERWAILARHYKVALRAIVGHSTDKCVSALLPPGCLVANSALVEGTPEQRSNASALMIIALLNSYVFSWLLGFYADLNVNLFALRYLPVPSWPFPPLIAHNTLRLCCNHPAYAALWSEQLGDIWREPETPTPGWPVIVDVSRRRRIQAINDAVFALEYGLNRGQYSSILDVMCRSERSIGSAECLVAFDELCAHGLRSFAMEHDPYWDLPLVTTLPGTHVARPPGPLAIT
ncbi:MAG TPA: hypothetical protein VIV60_27870 [Polyangiaceae bacterium]